MVLKQIIGNKERRDTEIEREEEEKEELYESNESDCELDYTENDKNLLNTRLSIKMNMKKFMLIKKNGC